MGRLSVDGLTRRFGTQVVVDDISFEVRDGEFLTLLGPSGCGKTTTLSSIAGLDAPTRGRIVMDGVAVFDAERGVNVAPESRNFGMVFQSYALWPHMSVRENVAFPLRMRKRPAAEREERVRAALALVEMEQYIDRYPHELSGGQQQRVALARAVVYEPRLMLLDEPLSNLDAKLRLRARAWLKELQEKLRITTIYVTHDQTEALVLSDRIAVMNAGRIEQLSNPIDLYEQPQSPFIADFVGHSNLLHAQMTAAQGASPSVQFAGQTFAVERLHGAANARDVAIAVRPENVILHESGKAMAAAGNIVPGQIRQRDFLGARYYYVIETAGGLVRAETAEKLQKGAVLVELPADSCVAFARPVAA